MNRYMENHRDTTGALAAPLVFCRDLHYTGTSAAEAIEVPALSVAPGEQVCVQVSGEHRRQAMLELMTGWLQPDAGVVRMLGFALAGCAMPQRQGFFADHVGCLRVRPDVAQGLGVLESVVASCLHSPCRWQHTLRHGPVHAEAERLLWAFGLDLDLQRDVPVTALNAWQRLQVAAAQALIGAPELVVAMAPDTGMSPMVREAFLRCLHLECARYGSGLLLVCDVGDDAASRHVQRTVRLHAPSRRAVFARRPAAAMVPVFRGPG